MTSDELKVELIKRGIEVRKLVDKYAESNNLDKSNMWVDIVSNLGSDYLTCAVWEYKENGESNRYIDFSNYADKETYEKAKRQGTYTEIFVGDKLVEVKYE